MLAGCRRRSSVVSDMFSFPPCGTRARLWGLSGAPAHGPSPTSRGPFGPGLPRPVSQPKARPSLPDVLQVSSEKADVGLGTRPTRIALPDVP